VGAGLLAKAVDQSTYPVTDTPLSRASRSHKFNRARTDYSIKVTTPPANDCTRASDSTR